MSRPRQDMAWFDALADRQLQRIRKALSKAMARRYDRHARQLRRNVVADDVASIGRASGASGPQRLSLDDLEDRA